MRIKFTQLKVSSVIDLYNNGKQQREIVKQITTALTVGGNLQVKKVLDWLYRDATIYLPRKYEKYLEFQTSSSKSISG